MVACNSFRRLPRRLMLVGVLSLMFVAAPAFAADQKSASLALDPEGDTDGDGLANQEEANYGTKPNVGGQDTDGDGIVDGLDGWAREKEIKTPRLPKTQYAIIEIEKLGYPNSHVNGIDDNGNILLGEPTSPLLFNLATGQSTVISFTPWTLSRNGFVGGHGANENDFAGKVLNAANSAVSTLPFPAYTDVPNRSRTWSVASTNGTISVGYLTYSGYTKDGQNRVNESWGGEGAILYPDDPRFRPTRYHFKFTYDSSGKSTTTVLENYAGINAYCSPFMVNAQGLIAVRNGAKTIFVNGSTFETADGQIDDLSDGPNAFGISNTARLLYFCGNGGWTQKPLQIWGASSLTGPDDSDQPASPIAVNQRGEMMGGAGESLLRNGKSFDIFASDPAGWDGVTDGEPHKLVWLNNKGWIAARAFKVTSSGDKPTAIALIPCDIVPDLNRDGIIDNKDRGKITKDSPHRIWINDDDDEGDVARGRSPGDNGDDDVPTNAGGGYQGADWQSSGAGGGTIDGTRDLVDFFPLWLDIKQLIEVLPTSQFTYFLTQEDGALNFAYTELKPDSTVEEEKAGAYLKKLTVAQQLQSAPTYQITAAGAQLTTAFINKIKDDGKGIILIEGRQKSNKPLKLEVRKGGDVIATFSFEISIDGVEKMFRQKNLMAAGGGSGGVTESLGEPENYPDKLCSNKVFVFVHGYSTSPYQARGWFAEIFKRLYWAGSKAKFYGVNWYGNETQGSTPVATLTPNYAANVGNAFSTAQAMKGFLSGLGGDVSVAAHSLGNMVVGSAIHDWGASPKNYFMVDAAVAKESYNHSEEQLTSGGTMGMEGEIHDANSITSWTIYNRRLWCSDWHNLFASADNRSRLTWKDRLSNVVNANAFNFFSSGEDVLANPNIPPQVPFGAREVWNLQERLKGYASQGSLVTSSYGGWKANGQYVNINGAIWTPTQANQLTNDQLKTAPFFNPNSPTELYGQNGSAYAANGAHRNTLLSEMIPALSFAAGSNNLSILGGTKNFDMMEMKNGGAWPAARLADDTNRANWLHSDIKAISFIYNRPAYDKIVELGELKK